MRRPGRQLRHRGSIGLVGRAATLKARPSRTGSTLTFMVIVASLDFASVRWRREGRRRREERSRADDIENCGLII